LGRQPQGNKREGGVKEGKGREKTLGPELDLGKWQKSLSYFLIIVPIGVSCPKERGSMKHKKPKTRLDSLHKYQKRANQQHGWKRKRVVKKRGEEST